MDRGRSRSPRRDRREGNRERKTRRGPPERRVFISNLPFEMKWQEVKDLFRKEVGEVAYVELFDDENGKPRGAGVMEFNTVELTKHAIDKMHRYEFKGRKIVVKEDFDVDRDKCGRIIAGSGSGHGDRDRSERRNDIGRGGGGGMGAMGDLGNQGHGYTYGLSPQFLDSLNISGPIHNRIFVANLDYKVDEKKLKEVFRIAGKVLGVELSRDKEGKSRGFAVVVYDHPVESVQAISMFNNQQLYDRKINVRFDKVPEEDPPSNLSRLPDGLRGIGMGLGQDGMPLQDVRANLPSPGDSSSSGNNTGSGGGLSAMSTGMGNSSSNNMMGSSNQMNTANNVGTAALQAALATIMGMGNNMGMSGNNSNNTSMTGDHGHGNNMNKSDFGGHGHGGHGGHGAGSSNTFSSGMGGSGMDRMGSMSSLDMGAGMAGNMGSGMTGGASTSMGGGWGAGMTGGGSAMGGNMGRRSDAIIVRNLGMDCTWQMLKDRFNHVGDIKYAEMKDRGVGVIRSGLRRFIKLLTNQIFSQGLTLTGTLTGPCP